jgi:mono/diheme cytochrome c family protein
LKQGQAIRIAALATIAIAAASLSIRMPIHAARQIETAQADKAGATSYAQHCAICHGDQREGILPAFPPLTGIHHRMTDDKLVEFIHVGKGRMPGFPDLKDGELTALVQFLSAEPPSSTDAKTQEPSDLVAGGDALFHQNCAFCHGRDAMGGENGPDLTQSKLALSDPTGEKISAVIREGRLDKKMPAFNFSAQEMRGIIAFIHARQESAAAHPGGRRGVEVSDLQTGNAVAGKAFFDGAGGCIQCHSPSGDLAGIASRLQGLKLERRMLYPEDAKRRVTITLPSGEQLIGTLVYLDEFTVGMRDTDNRYRSWPTSRVHYSVDAPAEAHVKLFPKYTDDDVHNLMAYLQSLR